MNTASLTLRRLHLQQMPGYAPQVRRSWATQADARSVQQLVECYRALPPATLDAVPTRLHRSTTAAFARAAQEFLQLETQGTPVQPPGGWAAPRFRFALQALYNYPGLGVTTEHWLSGYTSHLGVAEDGALDPQMSFTVNAEWTVRGLAEAAAGPFAGSHIVQANSVLCDARWEGLRTVSQGPLYRLRPEDMFATVTRLDSCVGDATDMRTVVSGLPTLAAQTNLLPAAYLQRLMEAYEQGVRNGSGSIASFSRADILIIARGIVHEDSPARDPVFGALSQVHGIPPRASFQLADLQKLGLLSDNTLIQMGQADAGHLVPPCDWSQADRHTLAAQQLGLMLPALLARCNLLQAQLWASGSQAGVRSAVRDFQGLAIPAGEAEHAAHQLRAQLELHVGALLGAQSNEWTLEASVNPQGESRLQLSLDGQLHSYVVPSFMDSLISPLVTQDLRRQLGNAGDIDVLLSAAVDQ